MRFFRPEVGGWLPIESTHVDVVLKVGAVFEGPEPPLQCGVPDPMSPRLSPRRHGLLLLMFVGV